MQQVQLYIEEQRVELFEDEIISLTQSIQNIKDPATIFTGFSQEFSLPATRETNKLFKHYYNFDVTLGYDARVKTVARIELNSKPFQLGKIRLQSVEMKDNVPYAYKVVFIGNLVELKDAISEDELSDLAWLDKFQRTFSMTDIKASLQDSTGSVTYDGTTYNNVMRTALISPTKRLYYDSTLNITGDGNLFYHSSGHHHGVLWSDLKFSIGVHMIVKAIEQKYGISFSNDWFSDTNSKFFDLFMYMHRKQGEASPETTLPSSFTLLPTTLSTSVGLMASLSSSGSCPIIDKNGATFSGSIKSLSNGFEVEVLTGTLGAGNGKALSWGFEVETTPQVSDGAKIYTVELYYTPSGGSEQTTPSYTATSSGTGSNSVSIQHIGSSSHTHSFDSGTFRLQITSAEPVTFNTGDIEITGEFYWADGTDTVVVGSMGRCSDSRGGCTPNCTPFETNDNASAEGALQQFDWQPTQQLPKMKVIDFLTGLFRIWNLTAYYDGDLLKVEPLDEFYGISTTGYELNGFSTPTGWSYNSTAGLIGSTASTTSVDNNFFPSPDKYQVTFVINSLSAGSIKLKTEAEESAEFTATGTYSVVLNATTTKLEIEGIGFTGNIGNSGSIKTITDVSTIFDISEYIDVQGGTVSNGLPYKQIDMRFKGHGSLLAKKFEQIFNRRFGDLEYTGDLTQANKWAGTIYKLEVPFEKCVYERLFDGNTTTQKDLQIGNMIDDSFSPYIGEPLLHYMKHTTGVSFGFLEDTTTVVNLTSYNAPLNTISTAYNSESINFFAEFNEWTASSNPTANPNNLFQLYYENYMKDVFNKQRRITSVKAWLPLKILLNYNLADRFKINQNLYRINSITTNLQSGESDIELLNEV